MKKMPKLKDLYATNTSKKRQSWREQLAIMQEWSVNQQKRKALLKELSNGR